MEVDPSPLDIQISEVFSLPPEIMGPTITEDGEPEADYTVIFVQEQEDEDELSNSDGDDHFEESQEPLGISLQELTETAPDECQNTPLIVVEDEDDDNSKTVSSIINSAVRECDIAANEESSEIECVSISDDDEIMPPARKPKTTTTRSTKRHLFAEIPEVTEESIFKEFYFEEEDISIVDDQRLDVRKKTLVRRTNDLYHCPLYCTFTTKEQPLMVTHLIEHKKRVITKNDLVDSAYVCPLCSFATFYHSAFIRHISHHKKINCSLRCSKCPFKASSTTVLKRHNKWKHTTTFLYCQNCPYKAKRKWNLEKHEKRCKKPGKLDSFKCHFKPCPFTAPTEENLKTHEWIQHQVGSTTIRSYKCPLISCHFETFREEMFEDHVEIMHADEELHKCKLCNYKTADFASFKEHILGHVSVP